MGKPTPAGQVIGHDGAAMTDSAQILKDLTAGKAALAPLGGIGEELGGYKGYGYATVVEILSAALQQGSYLKALLGLGEHGEKVPYHLGHFFMAIDTEAFMGLDAFKKTAGDILRALRASREGAGRGAHLYRGRKGSTSSGRNARARAYLWAVPYRRSLSPCATRSSCRIRSRSRSNRKG